MKKEYDFSRAERGKFFREVARLIPPVHSGSQKADQGAGEPSHGKS
jgi:hypothetical protein